MGDSYVYVEMDGTRLRCYKALYWIHLYYFYSKWFYQQLQLSIKLYCMQIIVEAENRAELEVKF